MAKSATGEGFPKEKGPDSHTLVLQPEVGAGSGKPTRIQLDEYAATRASNNRYASFRGNTYLPNTAREHALDNAGSPIHIVYDGDISLLTPL